MSSPVAHFSDYLGNSNPEALLQMYEAYRRDPGSVDQSWRNFFEGFEFARMQFGEERKAAGAVSLATSSVAGQPSTPTEDEANVFKLIEAYRTRGHLFTKTNPVRARRKYTPDLSIEHYGLSEEDLTRTFQVAKEVGLPPCSLAEIIDFLKDTYCANIGVEFKFIRKPERIGWISNRVEANRNTPNFDEKKKKALFAKMNEAVGFEKFLHRKFVGQKRFSLEGMEACIPALEMLITRGSELGIEETVIGMAHRGRLNILTNIMGKTARNIFSEFEGKGYNVDTFHGDVKYHMGFSSDRDVGAKRMHLSIPPNPSHLEAIAPVVQGIVRAKIEQRFAGDYKKIVPIIIHGDAAIAGQGIVYETLQASELPGYRTGGSVHIVMNNQIGFTTNYRDGRSSTYCTDVAKVCKCPIFHVNGDDVEAVAHAVEIAIEYRQVFHTDVFIDILGYRRYGHNEGDEPRFTQPGLYKVIQSHANARDIYSQKLISEGVISAEYAGQQDQIHQEYLESQLTAAKQMEAVPLNSFFSGDWKGMRLAQKNEMFHSLHTGVEEATLRQLTEKMTHLPPEYQIFAKVRKIYEARQRMVAEDNRIDWSMGELLAYASLLREGYDVRISGQDVVRGTFAHRHAGVMVETEEGEEPYFSLSHLGEEQGIFSIYNSLLSEYAVLGFEYGYALSSPQSLTIWEAQFGDFANGAQIVIDQFIAASETKWQRMNGVVLLLPHGYEGQGPEHSSARIERFLQLCADNNMTLANCTTPANFFHLLRRQQLRSFRKPTVVFTPKSLLRHKECVSDIKDISSGTGFQEIIDDSFCEPQDVRKVLLCSGKIFYDLLAEQREQKIKDIAIIRLEQLYPFCYPQFREILKKYVKVQSWVWVQEEPWNMGPLSFVMGQFQKYFPEISLSHVARKESSTTAIGFQKLHTLEQNAIVRRAFKYQDKSCDIDLEKSKK